VKSSRQKIVRWESGAKPAGAMDELAEEEPLEIRIDNQPVSVTMRTPGHDDELAAGFLLGEGLISRREEILRISPHPRNRAKNVIGVFLAPDAPVNLKRLTRHFYVSSSCGLCGKASIAEVRRHFPAVKSKISVPASAVLQMPGKLRAQQQAFARTGGLHAAGLFDLAGNLIVAREDVGRHNAVDKVLGCCLLNGSIPLDRHILLVSGRVSFEIVQKALAGRIAILAAVSAPSSLAVEFARANGQTLIGFVRDQRLNVYTHVKRVGFRRRRGNALQKKA
jgi:FdhD protein